MADNGHYGKRAANKSRQGIYVFTSDGTFLSSINNLSADRVLKTIEDGLKKWEALPPSAKKSSSKIDVAPKHRWENFYPRDGLVLTAYSRDLPLSGEVTAERLPTWNRDAAWFSRAEAEQLVPDNLKTGDEFEFPKFFVNRLAKLHFVDMVKGQTDPYRESQIAGTTINGKVQSIENGLIKVQIKGQTAGKVTKGSFARSLNTELLGQLAFDTKRKKFVEFEFVALGQRTGMTRFNDRRNQREATPIGFTFELTPADATPVIPGIIWAYDAPWLKPPS